MSDQPDIVIRNGTVFDGTGGCGSLVSLGCNDDSCGTRSVVSVPVTNGQLLYIRVGGWNSAQGSFILNVAGDLGPVAAHPIVDETNTARAWLVAWDPDVAAGDAARSTWARMST